jgi:hypothetical protein
MFEVFWCTVAVTALDGKREHNTVKLKPKMNLLLDQSLIEGGVVYRPRNWVTPKQKL